MALLDGEDSVADEVISLISELYGREELKDSEMACLFDRVFGLTCDSVNGQPIDAAQTPVCRQCRSGFVETFEEATRTGVKMVLPLITHAEWEKKSRSEKRSAIENGLGVPIRGVNR
jgi:hypothetical protein